MGGGDGMGIWVLPMGMLGENQEEEEERGVIIDEEVESAGRWHGWCDIPLSILPFIKEEEEFILEERKAERQVRTVAY